MEKHFYFRTTATLTDDDDDATSCMYPVNRFRGYYTLSATTLYLTFLPMHESRNRGGDALDSVVVTVSSGKGPDVIEAINKEISSGENHFIVIGDDVTSDYLTSDITAIGGIDITSEIN